MKTLHLLRHAKSAWDQPGLMDRERELNKRGQRDAPRMGTALSHRIPAVPIICSPARRAQLTLAGLCSTWPELAAMKHETQEQLYSFDYRDLLHGLSRGFGAKPEPAQLFLIGHNPAFTDLINVLAPTASLDNLPTAGYARLTLEIDCWGDLQHGCGRLEETLFPKQLSPNQ